MTAASAETATKERLSASEACPTEESARDLIDALTAAALRGIDPATYTQPLAVYGEANLRLALRGLETRTHDPYLAGWKPRVVPSLGHIPVPLVSNGAVDRSVYGWIADEVGRSSVRNSLSVLVRVMEQAVRDGIIALNPAVSASRTSTRSTGSGPSAARPLPPRAD